ncbi:hypothetical protein BC835DRAFT_848758 [Cytidiella melzeri]|nr:hypothetical protein BC835DRAFT_848758 [Cytidiella melzeri]
MAEEPPGRSRFFMGEELPEVTAAGLSQESYYFQPDQMSLPQTQASASAQASGPVASPILRGPSFAPAPGIHISPLRGNVADNKEKENEMRGIVEDRSNGETLMKEQNEPPQAIPQTPIKQIMSSVPKTPYAPRNLIPISTAMSVPKIAVVRVDDASDDEIDDPEDERMRIGSGLRHIASLHWHVS